MIEGADGQYYLQAGAILLAGAKIFLLFISFIHHFTSLPPLT
jgi:hypothetical protein